MLGSGQADTPGGFDGPAALLLRVPGPVAALLLPVLGLAVALERRVHEARFVRRHGRPDAFRWPSEATGEPCGLPRPPPDWSPVTKADPAGSAVSPPRAGRREVPPLRPRGRERARPAGTAPPRNRGHLPLVRPAVHRGSPARCG